MIRNWTPLTLLFPERYVEPVDVDVHEWSNSFEWEQDDWNGFRDVLTPPAQVVADARGDCEDYAFVVLSHHYYKGIPAKLLICFNKWYPYPRHVAVADSNNVYSNGSIYTDTTVDEYIALSDYDWCIDRNL